MSTIVGGLGLFCLIATVSFGLWSIALSVRAAQAEQRGDLDGAGDIRVRVAKARFAVRGLLLMLAASVVIWAATSR